jgi:hypothetical protein
MSTRIFGQPGSWLQCILAKVQQCILEGPFQGMNSVCVPFARGQAFHQIHQLQL